MVLHPDIQRGLEAFCTQAGLSQAEAIAQILSEWLADHGHLASSSGKDGTTIDNGGDALAPHRHDPQTVQYPGYFKGDGSL